MNMGSPTGKPRDILGHAYVPNSNEPGKLKVHFDVPPTEGDYDYWIIKLGPVIDEKYDWVVVSEPK